IITDPQAPADQKLTVFWHAREHAYETFSSFAMEGLVKYLLSDEANDARRHYVFVLHPMTNIDGVADGYEYRDGYDHPDPFGDGTQRIVRQRLDQLRADYVLAW